MNQKLKKLAFFMATAAAVGVSGDLRAMEFTSSNVGTTQSAPVNLDFRVRIPSFLFFQVGSAAGTVDQIDFTPTIAQVQALTAVTGSAAVNVTLKNNTGAVTITASNNSGGNGLGTGTVADGYINYSTITAAVSGADVNLVPPALTNAGGTTSVIPVTSGKVTNKNATWTYTYTPTGIPAAGDYGTNLNGGRVTYTAATP